MLTLIRLKFSNLYQILLALTIWVIVTLFLRHQYLRLELLPNSRNTSNFYRAFFFIFLAIPFYLGTVETKKRKTIIGKILNGMLWIISGAFTIFAFWIMLNTGHCYPEYNACSA